MLKYQITDYFSTPDVKELCNILKNNDIVLQEKKFFKGLSYEKAAFRDFRKV